MNSSGSVTVSTGTLGLLDTLVIQTGNIDLSVPGTYTLTAYIDSNAVNGISINDAVQNITIDVKPEFQASPQSVTLASAGDSTEICVESSFLEAVICCLLRSGILMLREPVCSLLI
ncbi:MAG: hypothetical protein U5L96_03200 [Owenweeksia sp.]|nr:hypothetical protein [Owenweeksia sp.]